MSQHSSLRSGRRSKQHRSVLKRLERLKTLREKDGWKEGESVFGIPKVKTLRIKLKKEKAAEAKPEEAAATTPQAAEKGAPKAAAAGAKSAAPAKEAAPKKEAKK